MSLRNFAKTAALGAALILTLSASKCDKDGIDGRYALEQVPDDLRTCAPKVNIKDYETNGKVLWKDAQRLIVALKADNNALARCHRSTIAWIDAQHAALNRYLAQ